jgi:hypothetical protein
MLIHLLYDIVSTIFLEILLYVYDICFMNKQSKLLDIIAFIDKKSLIKHKSSNKQSW